MRSLLAGLMFMLSTQALSANELTSESAYILQPGDILFVTVWNEPDLQREILILPDSSFTFPLIGKIQAFSRSIEQVTRELTTKLRELIPDADVTVSVKQLQGNKIYVIGNVHRPGEFPISGHVDVMQALSIAGGTSKTSRARRRPRRGTDCPARCRPHHRTSRRW